MIYGSPGPVTWIRVGPQNFWQGSTIEYDDLLGVSVARPALEVETCSWTDVEGLFSLPE
ncbi:MAG TPA: hypothetical protein PLL30_16010 [Candidatus Krumholzibacteria bacterium]|nr:hypothetical protein [Candidatus Krumholzibacteria bacterium]HPD73275.1 hypothetical protein [Candidatus Krumholzibacteria bacterium]HRY40237.1 hypothetical protein [Candidatus Krumholzibacteria bacterium]